MRRFTGLAYGKIAVRVTADVNDGQRPWEVLEEVAAAIPLVDWDLNEVTVEDEQEIAINWVSPCCRRDWGTKDDFIKRCAWCGEEFDEVHLVEAPE